MLIKVLADLLKTKSKEVKANSKETARLELLNNAKGNRQANLLGKFLALQIRVLRVLAISKDKAIGYKVVEIVVME